MKATVAEEPPAEERPMHERDAQRDASQSGPVEPGSEEEPEEEEAPPMEVDDGQASAEAPAFDGARPPSVAESDQMGHDHRGQDRDGGGSASASQGDASVSASQGEASQDGGSQGHAGGAQYLHAWQSPNSDAYAEEDFLTNPNGADGGGDADGAGDDESLLDYEGDGR